MTMIERSDLGFIFAGITAFVAVFSTENIAVQSIGAMFITLVVTLYINNNQNRKVNKRIDELEKRLENELARR